MNTSMRILLVGMMAAATVLPGRSDEPSLRLDFSGLTPEANQVTVEGAGFGAYPKAEVIFGPLPIDNAFEGATDGTGMIIQAGPGEGVMVFAPKLETNEAALVRVSIRTDSSQAAVTLATVGKEPDVFVGTNSPDNKAYFTGQYLRLALVNVPPSGGFQPLIQVVNTSQTESLTAYLDNFEVYTINRTRYYNGEFLNGDESDPPADKISLSSDGKGVDMVPPFGAATVNIPGPTSTVPLEMALIKAGTFTMGSPEDETGRSAHEGPRHTVTISNDFYIGQYEVTQAQWQAVMGKNPAKFLGDNRPVERVSWNHCDAFVQKLNELHLGYTFRLPTEAEWEYACRAGTTARYYWGDDPDSLDIGDHAWIDHSNDSGTQEIGKQIPNAWGLYDMNGNVDEWCQDWDGSYTAQTQMDPAGASSGTEKIFRGGDFKSVPTAARSAARFKAAPAEVTNSLGLRLVAVPIP